MAASAVFGLGLVTAAAANSHGEAVGALAKTNGKSDQTKSAATTERDTQGDTVSAIARGAATAAHTTGDKAVNHGGAVSAAAHTK